MTDNAIRARWHREQYELNTSVANVLRKGQEENSVLCPGSPLNRSLIALHLAASAEHLRIAESLEGD